MPDITLNNAVTAVYISSTGKILAVEQLSGVRTLSNDQFCGEPESAPTNAPHLRIEMTLSLVGPVAEGERLLLQTALRWCQNSSGRWVLC